MANIFISYSSTDKTIVQQLAALLEKQGWSVWWDRQIPIGQNFDAVIEHELDQSACTLVIWTARSVASEWVRAEASEAARQKKLVPILLEQVEVPLAFRNMEAALLFDWKGANDHPELELLFQAITNIINKPGKHVPGPPPPPPPPAPPPQKRIIRYLLMALLGVLGIAAAIYGVQQYNHQKPKSNIIQISGKIKTAAELPIKDAEINVEGTKHFAISSTDGSFHLKLDEFLPGEEITISTSHPDYEDKFMFFLPKENDIKGFDIYLNPKN